jgi:cytochrome c peroxidase
MRTAHWVKAAAAAVVASGAIAYGWTGAEPAKPTPGNRAELVELGRRLFFDPATSRTGRVSCAACHDPEHGFTDRAHPSRDETRVMRRRAMPVTDVPLVRLHSDGEFADVQALIRARLHDFDDFDIRHDASLDAFGFATYGNSVTPPPALARVADRVGRGGWYEDSLRAAFGDPEATLDRVVLALEAYTYSIKTGENAFDRWLGGDDAALGPGALRGLALFEGKAQCASCHVTKPAGGRAPRTDGAFHDVGISFRTARLTDEAPDRGLGAHAAKSADRRRDHMRFRTPSLRDVAKRGPYMHDGSMRTLADVLDYFDAGGARHRGLADGVRRLALADTEKDDLVAFLLALSAP